MSKHTIPINYEKKIKGVSISKIYANLYQYLKNQEIYSVNPPGEYNIKIMDHKKNEFIKMRYIKSMGIKHWNNPIKYNILYSLKETDEFVLLNITFSTMNDLQGNDINTLYMNDIVIEVWKKLGVEITKEEMIKMYPKNLMDSRDKMMKQSKMYFNKIFFWFLFLAIVVLAFLLLYFK